VRLQRLARWRNSTWQRRDRRRGCRGEPHRLPYRWSLRRKRGRRRSERRHGRQNCSVSGLAVKDLGGELQRRQGLAFGAVTTGTTAVCRPNAVIAIGVFSSNDVTSPATIWTGGYCPMGLPFTSTNPTLASTGVPGAGVTGPAVSDTRMIEPDHRGTEGTPINLLIVNVAGRPSPVPGTPGKGPTGPKIASMVAELKTPRLAGGPDAGKLAP
jgi:hypothetical protein